MIGNVEVKSSAVEVDINDTILNEWMIWSEVVDDDEMPTVTDNISNKIDAMLMMIMIMIFFMSIVTSATFIKSLLSSKSHNRPTISI
jgi:hypothetical protein